MGLLRRTFATNAPCSTVLIRLIVGGTFLSEGIQKFLFPADLGVGRFVKIGIPHPEIMAPFVGVCEIVCGTLLILGLLTRLAAIPMIINISVAIAVNQNSAPPGTWPLAVQSAQSQLLRLLADGPRSLHGLRHAFGRDISADRRRRLFRVGCSVRVSGRSRRGATRHPSKVSRHQPEEDAAQNCLRSPNRPSSAFRRRILLAAASFGERGGQLVLLTA